MMDVDLVLVSRATLLLAAANGAPILARQLLGRRLATPIDHGITLGRGTPLLGPDKSWRGLAAATGSTAVAAWLLGWSPGTGIAVAVASMAGDLVTSFFKRRLGLAAGASAPGLDQALETLAPLLLLRESLGIGAGEIVLVVLCFTALDLTLTPLLSHLRAAARGR
jgi:CDP-2,3-bis-(O-geranylgeranyl)-sn-glycerol synthase